MDMDMPRAEAHRPLPLPARPLAALVLLLALVWANAVQAAPVEVEVEGVSGAVLENVRSLLSIVQYTDGEDLPAERVRRLHQRAREEIRRALEPFGYYQPTIDTALRQTESGWQASYRIQPGPRVTLEEVTIDFRGDAADDRAFKALRDELELESGAPLLHAEYEAAKRRIMQLAAQRGYFDARWATSRLRIEPDAQRATATLVLDSGRRYAFGEVSFQQDFLADRFVQRFLRFQPGDPFDARELLDLQYALYDTDYFERVDVRAQRDQARNGRVPIEVALEPQPQNRYEFGIGYGTDTGPRVRAGWQNRYVNRWGHSLEARIELAEVRSRLLARYSIPLKEPERERLVFDSSLATEEFGDGEAEQFDVGVRRVEQSGPWQGTLSLDFQRNRDTIGGETTTTNLVMPGTTLAYTDFNDPIYATRGLRVTALLNGGSENLGSDVSYLRGRLGGEGVLGLWEGGRLLLRGDIGAIDLDDIDRLPLSQRFFAGGDNSVRGFDYQSLGPTNDRGQVVGGRYLLVGSVEFEQIITGDWGAAVFVDSGNAFNERGGELRTAAGVGLRYRSPVGVLRVDVAQAVDEGDESARLHLSLGVTL